MQEDGSSLAIGDVAGKIFHVANLNNEKNSNLVIQTLHWHAHGVNSLRFLPGSPYLMSGGAESVLVQWHLQKQDKTFVARIGDSVESISVSNTFYGLILGDNSVRVIRNDNNKCVLSHRNASFNRNCSCEPSSSANLLIVPNGDNLQFVDFSA